MFDPFSIMAVLISVAVGAAVVVALLTWDMVRNDLLEQKRTAAAKIGEALKRGVHKGVVAKEGNKVYTGIFDSRDSDVLTAKEWDAEQIGADIDMKMQNKDVAIIENL